VSATTFFSGKKYLQKNNNIGIYKIYHYANCLNPLSDNVVYVRHDADVVWVFLKEEKICYKMVYYTYPIARNPVTKLKVTQSDLPERGWHLKG